MTIFAMGFIFIMVFTVIVGVAAIVFISFDGDASQNSIGTAQPTMGHLYAIVRRVNTNTIETVDSAGMTQRWEHSGE